MDSHRVRPLATEGHDVRDLVLVGTGGLAKMAFDIARDAGIAVRGFVDVEKEPDDIRDIAGVPVIGGMARLPEVLDPASCEVVIAYGDNRRRKEIAIRIAEWGFSFGCLISPRAFVSPLAAVGDGVIVSAMTTIAADSRIGNHVKIDCNCTVAHDNVLGDYVNLAPGVSLAGNVSVGEGSYVYTGACVIPRVKVGSWAVVGAGSVVLHNVPDGVTVYGNPARVAGSIASSAT
jgi:acetyltransferase EpsM